MGNEAITLGVLINISLRISQTNTTGISDWFSNTEPFQPLYLLSMLCLLCSLISSISVSSVLNLSCSICSEFGTFSNSSAILDAHSWLIVISPSLHSWSTDSPSMISLSQGWPCKSSQDCSGMSLYLVGVGGESQLLHAGHWWSPHHIHWQECFSTFNL